MMPQGRNNLTAEEAYELEQELKKEGYRKARFWQSLKPGYYAIRSHSGMDIMGNEKRYDVQYNPH